MKTDRLVIVSFVLLAFGVIWLATHWNGTAGLQMAYPLSGSSFQLSVTNKGSSAVIGVGCTAFGLVLLFASFVSAVLDLAISRKG